MTGRKHINDEAEKVLRQIENPHSTAWNEDCVYVISVIICLRQVVVLQAFPRLADSVSCVLAVFLRALQFALRESFPSIAASWFQPSVCRMAIVSSRVTGLLAGRMEKCHSLLFLSHCLGCLNISFCSFVLEAMVSSQLRSLLSPTAPPVCADTLLRPRLRCLRMQR